MNVINQETQMVEPRLLKPHPRNPNLGDTDAIAESIHQNGFYGAIVAQKSTGHVLVGHHRLKAAQQLGAKEVPVIWVDVDDTRALKIMLADNRTAEKAHRDEEALAELLAELNTADDLSGTGYSAADLNALIASVTPAADSLPVPPPADNYKEQYGVIVMCEDAGHQEKVFNTLQEQGFNVRVVVT